MVGVEEAVWPEIEINARSEDERREPLGKARYGTAHVVILRPRRLPGK